MQLLYRPFGYVAIVYFELLVRVALALAFFHLVRSLLPRFWRAVAITGIALYAMSGVIGPRPGMLTILFSIIELDILLSVRRTGSAKKLWLLPPMFAIWQIGTFNLCMGCCSSRYLRASPWSPA